uniref:Uncharacterized protein n=1 Tax=Nothoprocta perdicaria TaxID=30464 RepID=A0A8C6Z0T8_NOTPE
MSCNFKLHNKLLGFFICFSKEEHWRCNLLFTGSVWNEAALWLLTAAPLAGPMSEGGETRKEATDTDALKPVGKVLQETSAAAAPVTPPASGTTWGGRSAPTIAKDVNLEVLRSGVACLPGTRDKAGRAVAIITTRSTAWLNPHCNTDELVRLLLYLCSIPRPECQALGLTVLVDARRCSPLPALFKAFSILQVSGQPGQRSLRGKFELLTSMKSLHKHIDASQLPPELDGTFPYCHQDWLSFRMVSGGTGGDRVAWNSSMYLQTHSS